jgi:hypothetical protein
MKTQTNADMEDTKGMAWPDRMHNACEGIRNCTFHMEHLAAAFNTTGNTAMGAETCAIWCIGAERKTEKNIFAAKIVNYRHRPADNGRKMDRRANLRRIRTGNRLHNIPIRRAIL